MNPEQEIKNIESFLDEQGIPKVRGIVNYSVYGRVTLLAEKYAQQSMHPTSETLLAKLALFTPEQLSALEVLLTPLTCG